MNMSAMFTWVQCIHFDSSAFDLSIKMEKIILCWIIDGPQHWANPPALGRTPWEKHWEFGERLGLRRLTRPDTVNQDNQAKMEMYPKLESLLATDFNWWSFLLLLAFVFSVAHCQVGGQVINNDPDTKQYLKRLSCGLSCAWAIMSHHGYVASSHF